MTAPITQAFVLGAGLGTRLKRLTHALPKPLIPLAGKPLIDFAFDHLISTGVERIVVNTHHCAEAYRHTYPAATYSGTPLTFRHEPLLLETGGGIKNVEDLLNSGPFIVYNGDILTTLPLEQAVRFHQSAGNEVTLVLRSFGGPLQITFAAAGEMGEPDAARPGRIIDVGQRLGRSPGTHLFTGISIVSPAFFARLRLEKISVVPTWIEMIQSGAALGGIILDEGEWWDLGTREQYRDVHRALRAAAPEAVWAHPTARIHPSARLLGATYVGPNSEIGANVVLNDSILWEGTKIAENSHLTACIVTANQTASGTHADTDF
jgi:mannose-1-phosphate guanylyltransferase